MRRVPPRSRLLWIGLAAWTAAALVRALLLLPARAAAEGAAGQEPWLWRRTSPEVLALERLLASPGVRFAPGETVRVSGAAPGGADASFVWHWAQ
jgi:hypothetical protein